MDLLKKCLIEFNNQWTNKITEKEVDDDEQLRFTLLDMQNFAKKYAEAITVTHSCKSDSELFPNKWKERCLLAENYINETPCDPDIYQEQLEAWSEWITYKQSMENTN